MEEYASSFLNAIDEAAGPEINDGEDEGQHEAETNPDPAKRRKGLRSGIFRAANIQDKLLEK
jgi:hypothetical protein